MRVICAMSGGVDSSAAASLLIEQGYEVIGMTMSLYDAPSTSKKGRGGTCCSPAEVDLARRACDVLGIPHYVVDERVEFEKSVIDKFADEYAAGRTPNPCALCNETIKFRPLLNRARGLGAELMATGHYARVEDGKLYRGVDNTKDQTYFLFAMGRDVLKRVMFPLGGMRKDDVREYASKRGLPNWNAPDSQELCFVPQGNYSEVVAERMKQRGISDERLQPGEIRDESGQVLGQHEGIHTVTVGQRRGLGVSSHKPLYVLKVLPNEREVVVGPKESLATSRMSVSGFRRLDDLPDGEPLRATVQFRYRSAAAPATIILSGETAEVEFDESMSGIASGQAAVVYRDEQLIGGGWIAG